MIEIFRMPTCWRGTTTHTHTVTELRYIGETIAGGLRAHANCHCIFGVAALLTLQVSRYYNVFCNKTILLTHTCSPHVPCAAIWETRMCATPSGGRTHRHVRQHGSFAVRLQ